MTHSATTLNPTMPAALGILSRGSLNRRDGGQHSEATTMSRPAKNLDDPKVVEWLIENNTEPYGDCLLWTGSRTAAGYGRYGQVYVHRLVAKRKFGDAMRDDLVVRHTCDNPGCVHVLHLEIGTQRDNIQDAIERGRLSMGSQHPSSRLTESDVIQIRALSEYLSNQEISDIYGVGRQAIGKIVNRRRWKHI